MMNMAMSCSQKLTISVRDIAVDMDADIVRSSMNQFQNLAAQNYSLKNKRRLSQKRKLPV